MKINIIETNINKLRDPFVLAENGMYYMYGTDWVCYKSSGDLKHWTKSQKELVVRPDECDGNEWAPEVHKFKGKYYMFPPFGTHETTFWTVSTKMSTQKKAQDFLAEDILSQL